MIAFDTNVVVRFLTRDDEAQFQKAYALFSSRDVFLCETVLLETEWVLRHAYTFPPAAIRDALRNLTALPNVRVSDPTRVALAIDWHEKGLDFADALHLAGSQHAESMATFDRKFIERASGLGTCPAVTP
ncbi:MAG: type II toxin-antitoxin system VapC family toxin [Deltaproteobacteria bacterium]|nr:type II toxin-antitoxin system VapC family toxin [Deltaproteobacteria bacterium]